MSEAVKGTPRPYHSPLRQQQATATRTRIAIAAGELFATHGYARTSIDQIATHAGVARPTVYAAFSGKPALLKHAIDLHLAGDDAPTPVSERPWFQELMRQRDQRRMLQLHARNNRDINQRVAALFEALRNAAAADDEMAELYATLKQQRLTGARHVAEALAGLGPLRDGIDLDTAADLLWTFNDPALWTDLVTDRGWPPDRYQTWLARTLQDSLLPP
jgi:AcrR family transcriptional regulator